MTFSRNPDKCCVRLGDDLIIRNLAMIGGLGNNLANCRLIESADNLDPALSVVLEVDFTGYPSGCCRRGCDVWPTG